jgi:hypothetical protein
MALRPDRIHVDSQIDYFMNEVAERGGIVVQSTVGSGAAMDQATQLCTYAAAPSGETPLGVLMGDMVNLDLTRQHENWHKEEVQQGGKVTIWSNCTVVTNRIYPGQTPVVNSTAYLAPSGYLAIADVIGGNIQVGKFLSSKDEDGFCKVKINLP